MAPLRIVAAALAPGVAFAFSPPGFGQSSLLGAEPITAGIVIQAPQVVVERSAAGAFPLSSGDQRPVGRKERTERDRDGREGASTSAGASGPR